VRRYGVNQIKAMAKTPGGVMQTILREMTRLMKNSREDNNRRVSDMNSTLDFLISNVFAGSPLFYRCVENLLKASLIEMWTAFEVLAGDLLKGAKSEHPECFRHLTGREKSPKFYKRHLMRDAYRVTFADDSKINEVLHIKQIDELHLIRNVLVHHSGIADRGFHEGCEDALKLPYQTPENIKKLKEWSEVRIDSRLNVEGGLVNSLVFPVIYAGRDLVEAVAFWLEAHQAK